MPAQVKLKAGFSVLALQLDVLRMFVGTLLSTKVTEILLIWGPGPLSSEAAADSPGIPSFAHQKTWVASDEMKFYLRQLSLRTGATWTSPCIVGQDLGAADQARLLDQWLNKLTQQPDYIDVVITAVLVECHWVPIVFCPRTRHLLTIPAGLKVLKSPSQNQGCSVGLLQESPSQMPDMCGFETIHTIFRRLNAHAQPEDHASLLEFADRMRRQFRSHLIRTGTHQRQSAPCHLAVGGAGTSDLHSEIVAILITKGVPNEVVEERAKVVLAKLGRQPLPWVSKTSKFTNLVNLLKGKNLRKFLATFLDISKFCEKWKAHQKRIKSASKVHEKCIKSASKVHQKRIKTAKVHQKCIKSASKVHQKCIKSASKVHQKCIYLH